MGPGEYGKHAPSLDAVAANDDRHDQPVAEHDQHDAQGPEEVDGPDPFGRGGGRELGGARAHAHRGSKRAWPAARLVATPCHCLRASPNG
jgi:hypothetical protein